MNFDKIFKAAENRDIAFMFVCKSIAEGSNKPARLKMYTGLLDYIAGEGLANEEELGALVIHNISCHHCGDGIWEDGTCLNCGQ